MALRKMTKAELANAVADATGLSRADTRKVLGAIEDITFANLANCVRTEIAGVQIEPKLRKATKRRPGRNPATGEEVTIPAKPASVRVAARPLTKIKEHAPSVRKLQNAL